MEHRRLRVLKKRTLRKIFEHKRDQVKSNCRTLYSEELHNLFPSPDIIRVIKSRKIRYRGRVKRMWGNMAEKGLLENQGVERTIMVKSCRNATAGSNVN
jgi:hypothetical protein